jgi:hypothetical protein
MCILNVTIGYRYTNRGATEAARLSTGRLRREWQASGMHGVFPCRPGALATILNEVGLGATRKVIFPCGFEAGPRLIEV